MRREMWVPLAAWGLLAAIAVVTLGSPRLRPVSPLGHDTEHALAFLALGAAFALAYPSRWRAVALLAVPVIGAIELLQLWAPGRHARAEDFVVNLLSFWLAQAAVLLVRRLLRR
jgi:VanZ family protein